MKDYYTATVKYVATDQSTGKDIIVSEQYLLDAINFIDAETRIYEEIIPLINGDGFDVSGIKRMRLAEIISGEGETWYKSKVEFLESDEKTGKIKKVKYQVLVCAKNTEQAVKNITEKMSIVTSPWAINSIQETKIKEIFITDEERL